MYPDLLLSNHATRTLIGAELKFYDGTQSGRLPKDGLAEAKGKFNHHIGKILPTAKEFIAIGMTLFCDYETGAIKIGAVKSVCEIAELKTKGVGL